MIRARVTRGKVAVAILLCWAVGVALLARRQLGQAGAEQRAQVAGRIDPATYYYMVFQGDASVGIASSALDTSGGRLRASDYFRGRLLIDGDSQSVEVSSTAYLSRRLVLDSVVMSERNARKPFVVTKHPRSPNGTGLVLPPSVLPVVFLLSGDPTIGRSASYWMYNPAGDRVARVTVRVGAESLFVVSDSAVYDPGEGRWIQAHTDTVRAWSIAPPSSGLVVWVDAEGRVVSAREPGGLRVLRTAYELAFTNWRLHHS